MVSTAVRRRVADLYGIDAEVLAPPNSFGPGPTEAVPGVDGGFFLLVSRLLPYKNVGPVVEAFTRLPHQRLVVVGRGPMAGPLRDQAGHPSQERDWLVAVMRSDGSLLYVVSIAPDRDFETLRPTFEQMLKSLRLR